MVSNMFGSEETSSYTLNEKQLTQKGSQEINYSIDNISEDQLTLSTEIQGFDFRLILKKE